MKKLFLLQLALPSCQFVNITIIRLYGTATFTLVPSVAVFLVSPGMKEHKGYENTKCLWPIVQKEPPNNIMCSEK